MKTDPIILSCAFRYALGRRTYVVSTVVDTIMDEWDDISYGDKKRFSQEILEHKERFGDLGMDMDEKEWMKIVNRFCQEKEENDRN